MSTAEMDTLDLARPIFAPRQRKQAGTLGARPHGLLDRDVLLVKIDVPQTDGINGVGRRPLQASSKDDL
jgi:hypothetical protein